MIKGLHGLAGVEVMAGNMSLPFINQSNSNTFQGLIRISGTDLQYFDNGTWNMLPSSYASVGLNPQTLDLLKWCEAQRTMAFNRINLAQKHPQLVPALEAIKRAEDNFETLQRIVTSDNA